MITQTDIYQRLQTVIDPETNLSIVAMGLIYDVKLISPQKTESGHLMIKIRYTLTTPGCPLAGSFQYMIREALADLKNDFPGEVFQPDQDIVLELTFDPPWNLDMMSAEVRAELGF